jgi:spermidine synthase
MRGARPSHLDVGIFLLSFSVLLSELLLTRIFSVTMFYHLSFMVVSLAMLGFGASGLVVSLASRRFPPERLEAQAASAAVLFGVSSVVAVGLSFRLPISLDTSAANWARIGATYLVCAVPFLFGGLAVSLILAHRAEHANRLYFFDLLGAALGCLVLIPATNALGAPTAILLAGTVAAASGAVLAGGRAPRPRAAALAVGAALVLAMAANARLHTYDVKFVKGAVQPATLALRWNSFSRVDVVGSPQTLWTPRPPTFAGYSARLDPEFKIPEVWLRYDADAATQITRFDGDLAKLPHLAYDVSSSAYQIRRYHNVLVIGPGGGRDVLTALSLGSGPVTGVEINPITVRLMRTRFRTFTGGLYDGFPGVRVVNEEGRSFLRRATEPYDLIEASLVDTWAASAAGAYALTENNLYTVEAFAEYLDHLTPDGVICFNRWFSDPPVESLRVVSLAREALARRGITDPSGHVAVVRTDASETLMTSLGSILIKKSPFTAAEIATLEHFAAEMGFIVTYAPRAAVAGAGAPPPSHNEPDFEALLAPGGAAFVADYAFDISPVSDDRPFFFNRVPILPWLAVHLGLSDAKLGQGRLGLGGQTLLISLATTAPATLLLLVIPLFAGRRRGGAPVSRGRGWRWAIYFGGLGLGFILVEIVLVQRFGLFLGYPVYSLSVVLFTMLLASGLGSLAAGRVESARLGRLLPRALGLLAAALLAYAVALPPLLSAARGLPIAARILLAVVTIAPLGFLMGVPFASGVRRASAESTGLVPWAWAVNGGASVFGSTLTVLISMTYGFTASFLTGALAYAASLVMIAMLARAPAAAPVVAPAPGVAS